MNSQHEQDLAMDVSKDIFYLDPEDSPFTYIFNRAKYSPGLRKCLRMQGWRGDGTRFEWR